MDSTYAPLTKVEYNTNQGNLFNQYAENRDRFKNLLQSPITIEIYNTMFTALHYQDHNMPEPAYIINSSARPENSLPVFICPLNAQSPDQLMLSTDANELEAIQLLFDQIISTPIIQMKFVD